MIEHIRRLVLSQTLTIENLDCYRSLSEQTIEKCISVLKWA